MPEDRAFHFTVDGRNLGVSARTLKEFVRMQQRLPEAALGGHAERGDLSRWIAKVFGDPCLAAAVAGVEERFRRGEVTLLSDALIHPIRERYEVVV